MPLALDSAMHTFKRNYAHTRKLAIMLFLLYQALEVWQDNLIILSHFPANGKNCIALRITQARNGQETGSCPGYAHLCLCFQFEGSCAKSVIDIAKKR
jgi:calcineurin-like phosphoesterase family protein